MDTETLEKTLENQVEEISIDNIHHHNICAPIKTVSELWMTLKSPPKWTKGIIDIVERSNSVIKNNSQDCHVPSSMFVPKERLDSGFVPKTLVCHDMKHGYLEDRYVGPVNVGNGYTFYHWSQIDIFVYFSHYLITIPPLSWINVAHKNGVPILGTFITEWEIGKNICNDILRDNESLKTFANGLVDISILYKLDGWLLNIENQIDNPANLKLFVQYLTNELHQRIPGSFVIWYDSVTETGALDWQNELNDKNRCYFDVCDGIFLNYTWKEENLVNTVYAAQHRILDVYVGIDVFGRGSFGGGQFNSHIAAKAIREHNLSMAIFAQGWTHQSLSAHPEDNFLKRFYTNDCSFWKTLQPYFYTHLLKHAFETFFYKGVNKEWYELEKQNIQLSKILDLRETAETVNMSDDETCTCLQMKMDDNFTMCHVTNETLDQNLPIIHHLFSTEIYINGNVVLYTYTKYTNSEKTDYSVIVLIQDKHNRFKKIICHSNEVDIDQSIPTVINTNVSSDFDFLKDKHKNVPSDWDLRCFNLTLNDVKVLEIGLSITKRNSLCLCGIGITTRK